MSERIQKALDGELPREALGSSERAELDAYEEALDRALAPVRAEPAPDLTRAVMSRLDRLPRHGRTRREPAPWRRMLEWLWAPRPVNLRPAWALAAAAVAGLLLLAPWRAGAPLPDGTLTAPAATGAPTGVSTVAGAAAGERVFVHFRFDAADARTVQLAAEFTEWRPEYALSQAAPGVWTVVVPVEPGVHQYAFVVDGTRWVADPLAPRVDDGFGGSNSRLDVVRPEPRRAL
ncbi:MAG TPA: glycogen-binding domain-containing protein [Longimicrobiales bacterium]|nr:glycogen-binding domain-containing protein [Longimicrobiales bacterium]